MEPPNNVIKGKFGDKAAFDHLSRFAAKSFKRAEKVGRTLSLRGQDVVLWVSFLVFNGLLFGGSRFFLIWTGALK